jgi:hypothetical protein
MMRWARGPAHIAPKLGVVVAAVMAALAFAPAAQAAARIAINSFTYDPSDSSGHTLILTATNNSGMSLYEFELQLSGNATISNWC